MMHAELRLSQFIVAWLTVHTALYSLVGVIFILLDPLSLPLARIITAVVVLYILVVPQEIFLTAFLPNNIWIWSYKESAWVYFEPNLTTAGENGGRMGVIFGIFTFALMWENARLSLYPVDASVVIVFLVIIFLLILAFVLYILPSAVEKRWGLSTFLGKFSGYIGLTLCVLFLYRKGIFDEWVIAPLGGACFGLSYAIVTLILLPWVIYRDPICSDFSFIVGIK